MEARCRGQVWGVAGGSSSLAVSWGHLWAAQLARRGPPCARRGFLWHTPALECARPWEGGCARWAPAALLTLGDGDFLGQRRGGLLVSQACCSLCPGTLGSFPGDYVEGTSGQLPCPLALEDNCPEALGPLGPGGAQRDPEDRWVDGMVWAPGSQAWGTLAWPRSGTIRPCLCSGRAGASSSGLDGQQLRLGRVWPGRGPPVPSALLEPWLGPVPAEHLLYAGPRTSTRLPGAGDRPCPRGAGDRLAWGALALCRGRGWGLAP